MMTQTIMKRTVAMTISTTTIRFILLAVIFYRLDNFEKCTDPQCNHQSCQIRMLGHGSNHDYTLSAASTASSTVTN